MNEHTTVPIIIAIDGPSGAGKGTIARYLSVKYGWPHIDSGLLYRYGGFYLQKHYPEMMQSKEELSEVIITELAKAFAILSPSILMEHASELRLESTANAASFLSSQKAYREVINTWLHRHGSSLMQKYNGIVVDGRDITTVVFPKAQIKIFVTADDHVRHERRIKETGEGAHQVALTMKERDDRDETRKESPLTLSGDAFLLDTTHLSIDEACLHASEYVTICCPRLRFCTE